MNPQMLFVMRSEVKVSFYVRKQASKKSGLYPILMRVSYGGERITIGQIGVSIPDPSYLSNGEVASSCPNSESLNSLLLSEVVRIDMIAKKLERNGLFSLERLKEEYRSEANGSPTPTVMEVFNEKLSQIENQYKSGSIKECTLRNWRFALTLFSGFLRLSENRRDLSLGEVTPKLFSSYESYLIDDYGYHRNTASKHLTLFRSVISFAVEKGYISHSPIANYRIKEIPSNVTFISIETLKRIIDAEFDERRLELTKDMFVFSCLTGLSYSDVKTLTSEHIKELAGAKFLVKPREKTKVTAIVPLLPEALEILDKYGSLCEEGDSLLPIYSNQKINQYLKEIAFRLDIDETLSFHVARHTFATLTLTSGVTLESVSKMLGHNNIATTRIYARVTPDKIKREFAEVKEKFAHLLGELIYK